MRVHFIGIGRMGLPMARHLQAGGMEVSVHDTDPAPLRAGREAGLAVRSLAQAVQGGIDAIFTCLPDDAALRHVAVDIARTVRPGLLYVDASTIAPHASAQVARLCEGAGVQYLRCAVSGNSHMAEAAQLTLMGSGPAQAWERALPLLRLLGPTRVYLGGGEQARTMNLVLDLMVAQTSAMLAEALTLGRKAGLDWQSMWQVLSASAVGSPLVKAKAQQLAQRDFTPTFTVQQMARELDLILSAASAAQVPLMQAALTRQWLQAAMAQGDGGLDHAAVIRVVERSAGLPSETIQP